MVAAALVTACGGGDSSPTPPTNKTIDVSASFGDAFLPTFTTVSAGDTVRWAFGGGSDGNGHNVRFTPVIPGTPADINVMKSGTATRVFTTKGDFKYVCDVHPGMQGEVIVQ